MVRLPVIITSPLTVPPTLTFNELLALTYALLAYVDAEFDTAKPEFAYEAAEFATLLGVLATKNAELAYEPEAVPVFAVAKAAFAYEALEFAIADGNSPLFSLASVIVPSAISVAIIVPSAIESAITLLSGMVFLFRYSSI
jgi:hypothetical protein